MQVLIEHREPPRALPPRDGVANKNTFRAALGLADVLTDRLAEPLLEGRTSTDEVHDATLSTPHRRPARRRPRGEWFATDDPFTGEPWAEIARGSAADVDAPSAPRTAPSPPGRGPS